MNDPIGMRAAEAALTAMRQQLYFEANRLFTPEPILRKARNRARVTAYFDRLNAQGIALGGK